MSEDRHLKPVLSFRGLHCSSEIPLMRPVFALVVAAVTTCAPLAIAQQDGPYKVLKTERVGGEGGWDYIYADADLRKLYIPSWRHQGSAVPPTLRPK